MYIYIFFFMGCCFSFNQEPRLDMWCLQIYDPICPVDSSGNFHLRGGGHEFRNHPVWAGGGRGNCFTDLESLSLQVFVFHFLFLFIFLFSSPFLFTLQMLPNAMPATQTAAASTATNGNQARHQSQPSAIKRHACHSDLCVRVLCVCLCVCVCAWESCVWECFVWECFVCGGSCVCEWCVWESCVCEQVVCERVVCERCVWESCVWVSCVWGSCVWESCVWALCVSKLCVRELCVRELCVREVCVWESRRGGRRSGRECTTNQKQEPHTKMWGKKLCRGNWQGYAKMLYNFLLRNTFVLI